MSRIVVVVLGMHGCPACEEYLPRFSRIAAKYKGQFPIHILQADDPEHESLANRLNVVAVPATFILRRPTGMVRTEGALPNEQIEHLLDIAAREAAR